MPLYIRTYVANYPGDQQINAILDLLRDGKFGASYDVKSVEDVRIHVDHIEHEAKYVYAITYEADSYVPNSEWPAFGSIVE